MTMPFVVHNTTKALLVTLIMTLLLPGSSEEHTHHGAFFFLQIQPRRKLVTHLNSHKADDAHFTPLTSHSKTHKADPFNRVFIVGQTQVALITPLIGPFTREGQASGPSE